LPKGFNAAKATQDSLSEKIRFSHSGGDLKMDYSNKVSQRGNPFGIGYTCSQLIAGMSRKSKSFMGVEE
jgi:hypothetical protein